MRRFLVIILCVLPVLLFAQVKKVAILETVDKEGNISYAYKLMLRSNLAKAISNAPGYEAYDRTDMDAIMGEQNFQRTGMVSNDQIKRLGEMTGASYILVAEAVKVDEQNMFITAKILNVETAKTEVTDNVLMAATSSDIQNGCESLANKLLGLGVASVNPSALQKQRANALQNTTTQQTPAQKEKVSLAQKIVDAYQTQMADKMAQAYGPMIEQGIGEVKNFPDGSRGVVFYKTIDGHGLAVSLFSTKAKWENVRNSRECHDIPSLPNSDGTSYLTYNVGEQNTAIIIQTLGAMQAPAAAWCTQQGTGWYLPSDGELWYLLHEANGQNCEFGMISMMLSQAGGDLLSSEEWYWSSTENDKDEAINVKCNGRSVSSEDKNSVLLVRAVRAF